MTTIDLHPLCECFPAMPDDEFSKLKNDIAGSGQLEPITMFGGKILDGRHRYRACLELDIEPWFKQFEGPDSPLDYVISKNLRRRHLTESQRAQVFAAMCNYKPGEKQRDSTLPNASQDAFTRKQAAIAANVSEKTVERAMKVDRNGDDSLKKAVINGEVTVKEAAAVVAVLPEKDRQAEALKSAKEDGKRVVMVAQELAAKPKMRGEYATVDQWKTMSSDERSAFIGLRDNKSSFNKQDNDSIEWADWSWNPVTGCLHDCPYCYARDIAERFYEQKFAPSFWPGRLSAPDNTRPGSGPAGKNVFANSMSDLYGRWVPSEWITAVLRVMKNTPQWNYLMLTKFPKRAAEFTYADNCWIGTSVDMQARVAAAEEAFSRIECGVKWLSIEPMIEPITFNKPELFNWVVIGGASRSTKTPEWTPPFEWIVRTVTPFIENGANVYLKANGRPREFPGLVTPKNADDVFHYLKQSGGEK